MIDGKLVCWFNGCMKTTMVLPDDLLTEVKVEAVHQHRKLNDLVPELIRIGLASQRCVPGGAFRASERQRAQAWLVGWQKLGARIEGKAGTSGSCVSLLEAERGTRG